ncbi:hypothetical protein ACH4C2_12560 [Streptomyces sp. NPDC018057]|uniref:hypothetical protein n=1 Tax=unclassified Streptomyces TaxID=2593676 RepID=UPI00378F3905
MTGDSLVRPGHEGRTTGTGHLGRITETTRGPRDRLPPPGTSGPGARGFSTH